MVHIQVIDTFIFLFIILMMLLSYCFGFWWRHRFQSKKTTITNMTDEQIKKFEKAFNQMDEAFETMNKIFRG